MKSYAVTRCVMYYVHTVLTIPDSIVQITTYSTQQCLNLDNETIYPKYFQGVRTES